MRTNRDKKVLVSGCFDLLHAGHIAFLKEASSYGRLFVGVGSDENIQLLKGRKPHFTLEERLYILNSISCVEKAFLASGSGMLDYAPDMDWLQPDIFIVNIDGHVPEKEQLCKAKNIEYLVLERNPAPGLPARSSTEIKKESFFPYRLCIAGGWIDQPWVSKIHPGSVVVVQIMPTIEFNDRSGMATSSRKVAIEIWGNRLPSGHPERNAKLLFGAENPPGTQYISGSQDHLGLLLPGINRLSYNSDYWPYQIESAVDQETCDWLSNKLFLVPLEPRPENYDPLKEKYLRKPWVKALGEAGDHCWHSILRHDVRGLGESMTQTFTMWHKMLPYTSPDWVIEQVGKFKEYPGAIPSGCGGGYIIVASEKDVPGALKIQVRF